MRGTLKLYLGKYTSRDWRRKRFTDDIDFWIFKVQLLENVLRDIGWIKNKKTGEWEKAVEWVNTDSNQTRSAVLCATNNLNQLMDFGTGSYLEGTKLREIFNKKIKRGHDVDLSDIINVVLYNGDFQENASEEWTDTWKSFEEAANTRNTRTTSNLISLCQYSYGISDHLEKLSRSIEKYHNLIMDENTYPNETLKRICRTSIHWKRYLTQEGPLETRKMILEYLKEQIDEKLTHSINLKSFADKILSLLNSRYTYQNIVFEIEDQ